MSAAGRTLMSLTLRARVYLAAVVLAAGGCLAY